MALIACPECGGKLSDKAKKCPHCGYPNECSTTEKMLTNEKDNDTSFELAGYILSFPKDTMIYVELRKEYEIAAQKLKKIVIDYYYSNTDLGDIIYNVSNKVSEVLAGIIDTSLKGLYKFGIHMTPETFLEKYISRSGYMIDYGQTISGVVTKYAEILNEKASLEQYLQLQRQSRMRWQGGGFGLKGAIKGVITAEMLNMGTDFIHSFGDASRKKSNQLFIKNNIQALKDSDYTKAQIINGAYEAVIGVFFALINELYVNDVISSIPFERDLYKEVKTMCESIDRYSETKPEKKKGYIDAICKYPYCEKAYRLLYDIVKRTEEEETLFKFLNYIGMEFEINGILPEEYVEINNYLDSIGYKLNNFYDNSTSEQVKIVSEMTKDVTDRYGYKIPREMMKFQILVQLKNSIS